MKKIISLLFILLFVSFVLTTSASAHIEVKPDTAGIGSIQKIYVDGHNDHGSSLVGVRVLLPENLQMVVPYVKPGWKIEMKKNGGGDSANVTEINWTGGSVSDGLKDEFVFSAQVPSSETTLVWKTYTTYQNGDVLSWDQKPDPKMSSDDKENMEKEMKGEWSETKVVNDLKPTSDQQVVNSNAKNNNSWLAVTALVLSIAAVSLQLIKK